MNQYLFKIITDTSILSVIAKGLQRSLRQD